jgi:hypothetical protein
MDQQGKPRDLTRLLAFVPGPVIGWVIAWQSIWGSPIASIEGAFVDKWGAALGTMATLTIFATCRDDARALLTPKTWRLFKWFIVSAVLFSSSFFLFRYIANATINMAVSPLSKGQIELLRFFCVIAYLAMLTTSIALTTFVCLNLIKAGDQPIPPSDVA